MWKTCDALFVMAPPETVQHILLGCIFAKAIWRSSWWPLDMVVFEFQPIECWISALFKPHEVLSVPLSEIFEFQLLVALSLDAI